MHYLHLIGHGFIVSICLMNEQVYNFLRNETHETYRSLWVACSLFFMIMSMICLISRCCDPWKCFGCGFFSGNALCDILVRFIATWIIDVFRGSWQRGVPRGMYQIMTCWVAIMIWTSSVAMLQEIESIQGTLQFQNFPSSSFFRGHRRACVQLIRNIDSTPLLGRGALLEC